MLQKRLIAGGARIREILPPLAFFLHVVRRQHAGKAVTYGRANLPAIDAPFLVSRKRRRRDDAIEAILVLVGRKSQAAGLQF